MYVLQLLFVETLMVSSTIFLRSFRYAASYQYFIFYSEH